MYTPRRPANPPFAKPHIQVPPKHMPGNSPPHGLMATPSTMPAFSPVVAMAATASSSSSSTSTSTTPQHPEHVYTSGSYPSQVLRRLDELRRSFHFCDVEIVSEGTMIRAHRAVLAASSPYFQAMFAGGLAEEQQTRVVLKGISPSTLTVLVEFVYTGRICLSQDNVQEIMVAADMLQLGEVVDACTQFLRKELDASNSLGIYRFAEGHNCGELAQAALQYIYQHFAVVCQEEEFLELPKDVLTTLLSSELLQVDSEFQVFSAAVHWILNSPVQRRRYVFEVLQHVRIPLISRTLLERTVESCGDPSLKVALQSIRKDMCSGKGSLVQLSVQPRRCAKKNIYVIGGSKRELASAWTRLSECTYDTVQCLDTFRKEWHDVAPMQIGRILPGIAALNGVIYVVGGEQESQILANGEVYHPHDDRWTQMASMLIPRCEFGLCALEACLYAFGGWVGEDIGGSIEKYDTTLDEWHLIGNMPEARFSMGVVAHLGLIYIVGGCTHQKRHMQELVSYNPVTREWNILAPMLEPRSQMGVAVMDDFLYVVGGSNKTEVLKTVERYSFEHDRWNQVAPMHVGRGSPAVAATNGHLYVIGGDQTHEVNFYRAQITIADVEYYDPETNTWYDCVPLSESRSEAGAVVL